MAANQDLHVFNDGPLPVSLFTVESTRRTSSHSACGSKIKATTANSQSSLPPKSLLVAAPSSHGEYPVVLFYHGFLLLNSHYSQLLQHVASHGFIVIAPQMYIFTGADCKEEIDNAAAIIDWLPEGLAQLLSNFLGDVRPRLDKVALIGHSRGAKVVFGLALGISKASLKLCAVAVLDPVDGSDIGQQTTPPILKFSSHCLELKLPVLIVGAGLGSVKRNALFPPCAPEGVSHRAFFDDCSEPSFYFVAPEHGHMDFLDDRTDGLRGKLSYCTCTNGVSRQPMRRFAGGILVCFLKAAFHAKTESLQKLISNPSSAPVKLEAPKWYIASSQSTEVCPDLSKIFQ